MSDVDVQVRQLLLKLMGAGPAEGDIIREDTPAWNSLRHVDLIFMLEEAFGIELTETEMAELDRLSAIVALVEQRRAA